MKDLIFVGKAILIAVIFSAVMTLVVHEVMVRGMDYYDIGSGRETLDGSLIYKENW